jgi:hypothetical protein
MGKNRLVSSSSSPFFLVWKRGGPTQATLEIKDLNSRSQNTMRWYSIGLAENQPLT